MKKVYLLLAATAFLASSCKKNYACMCTFNNPGTGGSPAYSSSKNETISSASSSSALSKCNSDAAATASLNNATYNCTVQ